MLLQEFNANQGSYPVLAHYIVEEREDSVGEFKAISLCGKFFDVNKLDDPWTDMCYCQECVEAIVVTFTKV